VLQNLERKLLPRIVAIKNYYATLRESQISPEYRVEAMLACGISSRMLETFNEAVSTILKDSIVQTQANPPTTWSSDMLTYVSREDLKLILEPERLNWTDSHSGRIITNEGVRDLHSISQSAEILDPIMSFPNSERMAVSRLIFNQDRRFAEAVHMIEPYRVAVAECIPQPGWSEAQVLEAQREVHNWVMTRTFALAPGLGFAHFDSRVPLLSEKFNIHGYNTLCVMKPMNNTVSVDRTMFTEEKYAWAWFHSGVAAGLSISKHADGIDSSWIVFNRPADLNNRHAGLLLALGLNGHLRAMAKWLAFKYLTPKHTMTSIGLLLGLSASHIGTMDTLVTRLLSVHVTRMLPPGAAELNLSSLTQTAGLMGIGLLYYNTQHRRMSEVMLSEIENLDVEDLSGATEPVRDESYRLAAGFALGLINLGQGADLKGLHDLRLVERLLAVAVGPRPVNLIHLMDQATAGATIAIMLVFLKTENKAVARKIDIPDTVPQFDFVRPDILLLRTLAKHLIMWNEIKAEHKWILRNLPREYTKHFKLENINMLRSEHMPFYNILAGLLWAISLKFAGSGDETIRDFLIGYLDQFIRICRLPAQRYDSKLTRNAVRNCQDLVALAAATVMAGTGDLALFRRLRSLHGRVNPETPYGSHMAGHMALGALFFGAGCYTFGTTNLAIASLIAAFYPVFPMDVTDNKAHLQAFRHFWALAAEARCIIPRDIDTQRTITLDVMIHMRDGTSQRITAPKLLPELVSIAKIETISSEFWPVTLDLANNSAHLESFQKNQTLHVRRRPAHEAHTSTFTATLLALNEARSNRTNAGDWIFRLPAFHQFEMADVAMFLDPEERGGALLDLRGSSIDERLSMGATAEKGWDRDGLWNLRILLRWADRRVLDGEKDLKWIRKEVLDRWKAMLERRARLE
jgi:anaphase-promoting complex subunit 1